MTAPPQPEARARLVGGAAPPVEGVVEPLTPAAASAAPPQPTALPLRVFGAVSIGHFAIDIFNSMGPVLLAFLRSPLGLSTGQIGFAVGFHQFLAGSTQPLFGWIADRMGSRWLGPVSVAWAIGCVCLALGAALGGSRFGLFVTLYALAAVGSGAFHPQGTMHASTAVAGRTATTTAIFFFCGQLGLASGPALAGLALDRLGPRGIYLLALVLAPVPMYMAVAMRSVRAEPGVEQVSPSGERPLVEGELRPLVVVNLAIVFGLRAWIFIGTAAFLPVLFQDQGWSSTGQGLVTGLFWLGGGIGGVLAGGLADRYGRRRLVFATTFAGAVVLLVLPHSAGATALLVAVVCGSLLGAPHSVLMVLCQELLPLRRGLASGLALGYLFAAGAVGSWGIGLLAERWPLPTVLQAGAVLGATAAILSLALPATRAGEPRPTV